MPALYLQNEPTATRFWEFFTAHIRNRHTRRAYFQAAARFSNWCQSRQLHLSQVQPIHVAAYIEELGQDRSRPTVKQHLAALRVLFDWLVVGQGIASNPAAPVRGPRYSTSKGKTRVLGEGEMRELFDSIDLSTILGLRDRALLGVMAYTFARVGAVISLQVRDYFIQGRRGWVRLQEKGGKVNQIPCHHNLEQYIDPYLRESGLAEEPDAPLFPAWRQGMLTRRPLAQSNVHTMIRGRAAAAGIQTKLSCHSFRATGITNYLAHGGRLEIAQQMAGHSSPRTTGLYDRRNDDLSLDEVERICY